MSDPCGQQVEMLYRLVATDGDGFCTVVMTGIDKELARGLERLLADTRPYRHCSNLKVEPDLSKPSMEYRRGRITYDFVAVLRPSRQRKSGAGP